MRIDRLQNANVSAPARTKAGSGARFVPEGGGEAGSSTGARQVSGLSSGMALGLLAEVQMELDPRERRRRQAQQGTDVLDLLDKLKLGLLGGQLSPTMVSELSNRVKALQPTGDVALDSLIDQIKLRAAVELAKLER